MSERVSEKRTVLPSGPRSSALRRAARKRGTESTNPHTHTTAAAQFGVGFGSFVSGSGRVRFCRLRLPASEPLAVRE